MDEMFELMTLRQTKKVPDLPIVLLCSRYWKTVVNWQAMADFGTVSQREVDSLFFADSADEAFEYIRAWFERKDGAEAVPVSPQKPPVFGESPSKDIVKM